MKKGIYDRVCEDVSKKCANDIENHSERCAAHIIGELRKSDIACKEQVLEYLSNENKVREYSDEEISIIMENQKKIDEREVKSSALVSNYRFAIKLMLSIFILILLIIEAVICWNVWHMQEPYKFFGGYERYINIAFVVITCANILISFLALYMKNKLSQSVFIVSWILLVIISFVVSLLGSNWDIGYINCVCCGLILSFRAFFSETNKLNKADSYNIMILILTLVALAVGVYSLILTKQSL